MFRQAEIGAGTCKSPLHCAANSTENGRDPDRNDAFRLGYRSKRSTCKASSLYHIYFSKFKLKKNQFENQFKLLKF